MDKKNGKFFAKTSPRRPLAGAGPPEMFGEIKRCLYRVSLDKMHTKERTAGARVVIWNFARNR